MHGAFQNVGVPHVGQVHGLKQRPHVGSARRNGGGLKAVTNLQFRHRIKPDATASGDVTVAVVEIVKRKCPEFYWIGWIGWTRRQCWCIRGKKRVTDFSGSHRDCSSDLNTHK